MSTPFLASVTLISPTEILFSHPSLYCMSCPAPIGCFTTSHFSNFTFCPCVSHACVIAFPASGPILPDPHRLPSLVHLVCFPLSVPVGLCTLSSISTFSLCLVLLVFLDVCLAFPSSVWHCLHSVNCSRQKNMTFKFKWTFRKLPFLSFSLTWF